MAVNEEAVKDMKGVKRVRVAAMSSCGGLAAKKKINIFGDRNEVVEGGCEGWTQ